MDKIRVGITVGDINGIGLEVIIKTLSHPKITDFCTPVIYGSAKIVSYHKNIVKPPEFVYQSLQDASRLSNDRINIVNCWTDTVSISLGEPTEESGKFAYIALDRAAQDIANGLIDALITAPIHKHAMSKAGFPYTGHTDFLTEKFGDGESLMLMVGDQMRVGVATDHIPISEVSDMISKELLLRKIGMLEQSLKRDFGIEKPLIAVLGLNPHAGEEGLLGTEEIEIIRPAIIEMKKKGSLISGPHSADGFFGSGEFRKVDGILAMYHDQGLIPFKALNFGQGVNFTAGLNIIRTSPDHGTAHRIAGQNVADPSSFRKALFLALDLHRNRSSFLKYHDNPLKKKALVEDGEGTDEAVEVLPEQ
ncbi:MAG: 4-hydroxythreonine-4-phosphate dehydrogenase PdxA [Saprospiraceae bacterium]|nr:4-hydroxythreonine-4-phosphate dehydrogenase PdxA [Saprospiraceae bacterium]